MITYIRIFVIVYLYILAALAAATILGLCGFVSFFFRGSLLWLTLSKIRGSFAWGRLFSVTNLAELHLLTFILAGPASFATLLASIGLSMRIGFDRLLSGLSAMRKFGRSTVAAYRFPLQLGRGDLFPPCWAKGGFVRRVVACSSGVSLLEVLPRTGRVRWQLVVPWELWDLYSPAEKKVVAMTFFKKPGPVAKDGGTGGPPPLDEEFCRDAPTLALYLGADVWPDGSVRQRSTMVAFVEEGGFKVCLTDKDTACTIWAFSPTWEGLPGAIEARLTEERPDWRKQRPFKKRT
jgi:hypothetical protein